MLRSVSPNISVITNFGCRANCWYCIWKGHKLEKVNKQTDWYNLDKFLRDNKDRGKVSLSGGGDCLYKFDEYIDWWKNFLDLTKKYNLLVDVHTREKFYNDVFWKFIINRCVFSSDNLDNDREYLKYLSKLTKVRITHLVTANTSFETIYDYLDFQNEIGCQFTIKQLVGFNDNGMYNLIRKEFPNIYYLDKGDYNIYYMPDNNITETFL